MLCMYVRYVWTLCMYVCMVCMCAGYDFLRVMHVMCLCRGMHVRKEMYVYMYVCVCMVCVLCRLCVYVCVYVMYGM